MSLELFNGMIEGSIEQIENLPDFVQLPKGAYRLRLQKIEIGETKDKKGKLSVVAELVEPVEVADEIDAGGIPPAGSLVGFQYADEYGIKKFKKAWQDVVLGMNCTSIAEFMDQAAGTEVLVDISRRVDREDKTKVYMQLNSAVLAP